jgi:hypothetical protein
VRQVLLVRQDKLDGYLANPLARDDMLSTKNTAETAGTQKVSQKIPAFDRLTNELQPQTLIVHPQIPPLTGWFTI